MLTTEESFKAPLNTLDILAQQFLKEKKYMNSRYPKTFVGWNRNRKKGRSFKQVQSGLFTRTMSERHENTFRGKEGFLERFHVWRKGKSSTWCMNKFQGFQPMSAQLNSSFSREWNELNTEYFIKEPFYFIHFVSSRRNFQLLKRGKKWI